MIDNTTTLTMLLGAVPSPSEAVNVVTRVPISVSSLRTIGFVIIVRNTGGISFWS